MRSFSDDELISCLPHLRRYALYLTRDEDAAEDLVQDAIVDALSGADGFILGRKLRPWITSIMLRHFHNGLRQQKQLKRGGQTVLIEDHHASTGRDAQFYAVAVKEALSRIAKLPISQRSALLLTSFEGHTGEEAAQVMGTNAHNVTVQTAKARRKLREHELI